MYCLKTWSPCRRYCLEFNLEKKPFGIISKCIVMSNTTNEQSHSLGLSQLNDIHPNNESMDNGLMEEVI